MTFDREGLCSFCAAPPPAAESKEARGEVRRRFAAMAEELRRRDGYQCLVAYSGGKDSTYALHLMKEVYQLRVLAYSLDNWFQSEQAERNVRAVVGALGIDHLTVRPSRELFTRMVRFSVQGGLHSAKALERASTICLTCIALVRYTGFRIAAEKKIPLVVLGMSPGQAPLRTAFLRINAAMLRRMQAAVAAPLEAGVGREVRAFFLEEHHLRDLDLWSANPLAFCDYREDLLLSVATNLGWSRPLDTDGNSTNCRLNALANRIHLEGHGFNPYAWEIAAMVRQGLLSRDEGLRKFEESVSSAGLDQIRRELGI